MDSRPLPVETVSFTDRCAHRQIQSLAHLQCTHTGNEDQARKGRRDNICLQKPPVQLGKRKHPSAPANAPTERKCLLGIQKLCTAEQVHREKLCHHKDVWRPLVHFRCHCTDAIKNFPRAFARCVCELTSHLAGHVPTLYLVECGSVRNDN